MILPRTFFLRMNSRCTQLFQCLLWCLLLISFVNSDIVAQPSISYIIPDVGAPGMQVYVEVIGQWNTPQNFSNQDRIFFNNEGNTDMRVECELDRDKSKISFSPVMSSWNGRMISFVAFISSGVLPNSDKWFELNSEFRIPIKITKNGSSGRSSIDTFYIVRPTQLGDLTNNPNSTLGQGNLGVRSRRGAMVIDNVTFGQRTYSISTDDCDPATPGNQGYLPFVLLSKGSITGTNVTSSQISLNAQGRNAGPGGGGGAGQICNAIGGGDNGGEGFTSGGEGGNNPTRVARSLGTSTSINGLSLNGVAPGNRGGAFESAGGGTGHPFGQSGDGCSSGSGCTPEGKYGGASGVSNSTNGASAGFGTDGRGTSSNTSNRGRANGNIMLIPLSGGSGGAGGNPHGFLIDCAGNGGGGGGGIALYSNVRISDLSISANGASGSTASLSGGSGSGGGIILSSRENKSNISLSAISPGNSTGVGDGRIRIDGMGLAGNTSTPESRYTGPTIDGTIADLPQSVFPLTLSGYGANGNTIRLYARFGANGNWQVLPNNPTVGSNARWVYSLSAPTGPLPEYIDILAVQLNSVVTNDFLSEPEAVFSGNSAIRINIATTPDVVADLERDLGNFSCRTQTNGEKFDTMFVRNTGSAPVTITSGGFRNNEGFTVEEPTNFANRIITAGGNIRIIVRFKSSANRIGPIQDELIINYSTGTPFTSTLYKVNVQQAGLALRNADNTTNINSIDFGPACRNQDKEFQCVLRNVDPNGQVILNSLQASKSDVTVINTQGTTFQLNDSKQITLRVRPTVLGRQFDTLTFSIDVCNLVYKIPIEWTAVETRIVGYPDPDVAFGNVRIGQSATKRVTITNEGTDSAYIRRNDAHLPATPYSFAFPFASDTIRNLRNGESIIIDITFSPTQEGDFTDSLNILSVLFGPSCPQKIKYSITGRGTNSNIIPNKPIIDFRGRTVSCRNILDSVSFVNTGLNPAMLYTSKFRITGNDSAFFRVVKRPLGDSTTMNTNVPFGPYVIEFVPDTSKRDGVKTAILEIETRDDVIKIVRVNLRANFVGIRLIYTTLPWIENNATINSRTRARLTITNVSRDSICIGDILLSGRNPITVPLSFYNLPINSSVDTYIDVTPNTLDTIRDTVRYVTSCPCADTIGIPFTAIPTLVKLSVTPTPINFGTVQPCTAPNIALRMRNNDGASTARIDSIQFVGQHKELFRVSVPWATYPYNLPSNFSLDNGIVVSYNGAGTRPGNKNAWMVISYNLNNRQVFDSISVSAIRATPITVFADTMKFGSKRQGQLPTLTTQIDNNGSESVTISVSTQRKLFSPIVVGVPNIPPLRNESVRVEFTTDSISSHKDTLFVKFTSRNLGCTDSIPVLLLGDVIPGLNYRVWLDSIVTYSPTERAGKIAIWGKLDTAGLTLPRASFRANLSFPADLFMPNGINARGGVISNFNGVTGNRRSITITVDTTINPISPDSSVLAEILGICLLGANECDTTSIDSFEWTNLGVKPTTWVNPSESSGLLCITICKSGGDRLLGRSDTSLTLMIAPNPIGDNSTLTLTSVERGTHTLIMSTATGIEVWRRELELNASDKREFSESFNGISNGAYIMEIKSPTLTARTMMIVAR